MSNDPSDVSPTPAVPLEYFQRNSGPWYLVMQFMARAGIVYSIIVLAGEVTELIYLAHQHLTLGGMITTYGPHLIVGYFPAVIAVFLVSGCRMALRLKPAGRSMIVWASLGMIGCYILMLAANEWDAYGYYQRVRGYTLGNTIFQMINSIFWYATRAILPSILWIVFRHTEVREVFEG